MTDRLQISTSAQHPRSRPTGDESGLCALEDYTCLTGESFAMRSLRAQLRRVSPHFRIALIIGEAGTSKETVALALHRLSAESDVTFASHNAASLLSLLPDMFTRSGPSAGASEAGRSTLFLSDVGDLSRGEQGYLLEALRRISAPRSGFERPRLIFATGRDLRSLCGAGHFNRSLYRMISAVEILLPPLRSRPEDIPLITCGLLSRSARSGGISAGAFDGQALSRLQCYDWPGNIRELERVVHLARQHAGAVDGVIEAMHLPPLGEFARSHQRDQIESRVERLDDVIQNHVLDVLLRCSGNKVRAAERLGISRSTLYRMLDTGAASALDRIA